jgi:hypothetical protein
MALSELGKGLIVTVVVAVLLPTALVAVNVYTPGVSVDVTNGAGFCKEDV